MLIDLLLALGVGVVSPLALRLLPGPGTAPYSRRWLLSVQVAGLVAAGSLLLPAGPLAAGLVTPWLAAAAAMALVALLGLTRGPRPLESMAGAAAPAYLLVGAGWLFLSRAGVRPMHFSATIVELTAVHFHYTGLAAVTIAQRVLVSVATPARRRAAVVATALLVAGSPIVAAGFTVQGDALQMVGVACIAAAVMTIGVLLILLARDLPGASRWLLRVAGASVFVPMPLALDFTAAKLVPVPALSIQLMAAIHGTANAVLFCLCGLAGLHLAGRPQRPP